MMPAKWIYNNSVSTINIVVINNTWIYRFSNHHWTSLSLVFFSSSSCFFPYTRCYSSSPPHPLSLALSLLQPFLFSLLLFSLVCCYAELISLDGILPRLWKNSDWIAALQNFYGVWNTKYFSNKNILILIIRPSFRTITSHLITSCIICIYYSHVKGSTLG